MPMILLFVEQGGEGLASELLAYGGFGRWLRRR